jgi:membrane fusion protein (multidrug efflux system)
VRQRRRWPKPRRGGGAGPPPPPAAPPAWGDVPPPPPAPRHARDNADRVLPLVSTGALPAAKGDDARAALQEAQAVLQEAKASLKRAQEELGSRGERNARVRAAEAAVARAKLDLSYTHLTDPVSGVLGNVGIRAGSLVEVGENLFPLVESDSFWVDANYKETDLSRIHPGQPATITLDMYPGITFQGAVLSLSDPRADPWRPDHRPPLLAP